MIFSCRVKSGWTGGFWMRRCWRPPGPQEQHVRVPCRPPGRGFPDEEFADLFRSGRGRPSIPATVIAAVIALQTLHDYSDRETAEAVRFDVRWKVACGLAVDDEGFDASTLVYWRRRIAKSERPHRINDAIRKIV